MWQPGTVQRTTCLSDLSRRADGEGKVSWQELVTTKGVATWNVQRMTCLSDLSRRADGNDRSPDPEFFRTLVVN